MEAELADALVESRSSNRLLQEQLKRALTEKLRAEECGAQLQVQLEDEKRAALRNQLNDTEPLKAQLADTQRRLLQAQSELADVQHELREAQTGLSDAWTLIQRLETAAQEGALAHAAVHKEATTAQSELQQAQSELAELKGAETRLGQVLSELDALKAATKRQAAQSHASELHKTLEVAEDVADLEVLQSQIELLSTDGATSDLQLKEMCELMQEEHRKAAEVLAVEVEKSRELEAQLEKLQGELQEAKGEAAGCCAELQQVDDLVLEWHLLAKVEDEQAAQALFDKIDVNKDGVIDRAELHKWGLEALEREGRGEMVRRWVDWSARKDRIAKQWAAAAQVARRVMPEGPEPEPDSVVLEALQRLGQVVAAAKDKLDRLKIVELAAEELGSQRELAEEALVAEQQERQLSRTAYSNLRFQLDNTRAEAQSSRARYNSWVLRQLVQWMARQGLVTVRVLLGRWTAQVHHARRGKLIALAMLIREVRSFRVHLVRLFVGSWRAGVQRDGSIAAAEHGAQRHNGMSGIRRVLGALRQSNVQRATSNWRAQVQHRRVLGLTEATEQQTTALKWADERLAEEVAKSKSLNSALMKSEQQRQDLEHQLSKLRQRMRASGVSTVPTEQQGIHGHVRSAAVTEPSFASFQSRVRRAEHDNRFVSRLG